MDMTPETQHTQKPSLFRRTGRMALRTSLTLGVAAIAVLALQFGTDELTRRAEAAPSPAPAPVIPVATAPIVELAGYEVTRAFTGQVEARRTVPVSFELSGRLDEIRVDEGDAVAAGAHIATLDMRLLEAERDRLEANRAALEAQLRFAELTVERQARLSEQGFASQAGLDEALSRADELRSRIAEVDAGMMTNTIQIEKSQIFAPFAGQITMRAVDGGESISPGQTLVEIVEAGAPLVRVGVPLDVTEADLTGAEIEVAGVAYAAELIALRPDVDSVTRTRTALFEIAAESDAAFGQTARLVLTDSVETPGLWVPVTTLKEGVRGQWTLLAVDGEDTVRALSVQVLHMEADRVFVRGAFPEDAQLITKGPQRIAVGQAVDPQPAL